MANGIESVAPPGQTVLRVNVGTVSDSRGRWSFRTPVARPIRAGMLTVSSGKIVRQLDFSGAPVTGIVLR
jgi:hypothetical protein